MKRRKWLFMSVIALGINTLPLGCTGGSKSDLGTVPTSTEVASKATPTAVDLRGPIEPKGRVVQEESLFAMKDMTLTTSVMGQEIKRQMSMVGNGLEQTEILSSDTTGPTRVRVRILRETMETTMVVAGQTQKDEERDPLDGQTVIGSKVSGKWLFTLEKGEPTMEQAAALRAFAAVYTEERSLYPAQKTSIGQSWSIPSTYFAKVLGADDIDALSASGDATLKDIVDHKGRRHALISITMKFEGRQKTSDLNVVFRVSGEYYRDLTHYVDVDAELTGHATYSGIVTQQGMKIQMRMDGPVTMSYSQRILE